MLAGALALAGCGGGNDSPAGGDGLKSCPTPNGKLMVEDLADCPDGDPGSGSDAIAGEADDAKGTAADAFKKAEDASKANVTMPKTGFADVQGVSSDAAANAQAILDAETEIADALKDARAALADAKALPDDAAGKARLVKSIETDIKEIEGNQKTVKALATNIRGSNKAKPRDAAHWGTEAAKALNTALITSVGTRTGDGSGLVAADDVLFHGSTRPDGARNFRNAPVKGEKLGGTGNLSKGVPGQRVAVSDTLKIDGLPTANAHFVCVSADGCAAVGNGKEIGDGWYFTDGEATTQDDWYVKNADGTAYEQAKYLEWGVWFDGTAVKSFAGEGAGSLDGAFAASAGRGETDAGADLAKTATYEGDAHGLSTFRASTSGETPEAVRSGHFMADVELKATFGTTTKLEGMIDNFRGDAVNTGWKVEITGGELNDTNGNTVKGTGRFTNQTYGEAGQRPTGIVGTFGRNFSDGAVDGVYHAK